LGQFSLLAKQWFEQEGHIQSPGLKFLGVPPAAGPEAGTPGIWMPKVAAIIAPKALRGSL